MSDLAAHHSRRWLVTIAVAASLVVPSVLPGAAFAQDAKGGMNLAAAGMGKLDAMLDKANATPDQKAKIKAVMFDALMSLHTEASTFGSTLSQLQTSLMAPHVDRVGLERARVSTVEKFDAFSKVMVKAIGDAAEVLTPEQRAKLAASAKPKG